MVYRIINAWSMGKGQKICLANLGTAFSDQLHTPSSPSCKKRDGGKARFFGALPPLLVAVHAGWESWTAESLRWNPSLSPFSSLAKRLAITGFLVVAHPSRQPLLPSARHAPQP